jgi:hypothetical protein
MGTARSRPAAAAMANALHFTGAARLADVKADSGAGDHL